METAISLIIRLEASAGRTKSDAKWRLAERQVKYAGCVNGTRLIETNASNAAFRHSDNPSGAVAVQKVEEIVDIAQFDVLPAVHSASCLELVIACLSSGE